MHSPPLRGRWADLFQTEAPERPSFAILSQAGSSMLFPALSELRLPTKPNRDGPPSLLPQSGVKCVLWEPPMSLDVYSLDELARHLGRDRREIEWLVSRGRIPGRKTDSGWIFHERDITQWLEREIREYSDPELKALEETLQENEPRTEIPVSILIHPETVQVPLQARTRRSVLESLVEVAGRTWQVWEPAKVLAAVQQREDALSTAFAEGVAIPHPRNPLAQSLGSSIVAYGRVPAGIPFGSPSGNLTDIFFLVLCRDSRMHLQVLARLSRMIRQPGFLDALRESDSSEETYELIRECDRIIGGGPDP